jgi:hypothetical protein
MMPGVFQPRSDGTIKCPACGAILEIDKRGQATCSSPEDLEGLTKWQELHENYLGRSTLLDGAPIGPRGRA